jgi:hypothetical protein
MSKRFSGEPETLLNKAVKRRLDNLGRQFDYEGVPAWVGLEVTDELPMELHDGSVFVGQWLQGERHGKGVIFYRDGGYYEGWWKLNCFHGRGRRIYAEGGCYIGQWANGKANGYGMSLDIT